MSKGKDGYFYVKKKKVSAKKTELKFDGRLFYVDLSAAFPVSGRMNHIYMDYDTGKTLSYEEGKGVEPQAAFARNATSLVKAAAAGVNSYGLIVLILCLVAGFAVGFLIGQNVTIPSGGAPSA